MNSMINMMKNRSRNFAMLMKRKIASIILKRFATCDLVFALEARTDVCTTRHVAPYAKYLVDTNWGSLPKVSILEEGPAVILVVVD